MSVYYDIKEHLFLQSGCDSSVAYMMEKRLALLGADMLMGDAGYIYTLQVTKGARSAAFKGDEIGPGLKEAIALIAEAEKPDNTEDLVVDMEYHFRWHGGDVAFCDDKSPFPLCEMLHESYEAREKAKDGSAPDPEAVDLEKLHYVLWNTADCSDGMGNIYIFGKDPAGKLWHGESPEKRVTDTLPADAKWYNNVYLFSYDEAFTPELAEACRRLSILGGSPYPFAGAPNTSVDVETTHCSPDLTLNGDEGEYILDSVSLSTPEEVHGFAEQMVTVLRLTGETEFEGEFFDGSSALPRMLYLYVNAEGSIRYELMES